MAWLRWYVFAWVQVVSVWFMIWIKTNYLKNNFLKCIFAKYKPYTIVTCWWNSFIVYNWKSRRLHWTPRSTSAFNFKCRNMTDLLFDYCGNFVSCMIQGEHPSVSCVFVLWVGYVVMWVCLCVCRKVQVPYLGLSHVLDNCGTWRKKSNNKTLILGLTFDWNVEVCWLLFSCQSSKQHTGFLKLQEKRCPSINGLCGIFF